VEDVPHVTKAFDRSDIPWPEPKDRVLGIIRPNHHVQPPVMDNGNAFGMPGFGVPPPMNIPPHVNINANLPGFNPLPNGMDFNNPWSLAGVPPPPTVLPGVRLFSICSLDTGFESLIMYC